MIIVEQSRADKIVPSHYDTLGITPSASAKEITVAYRALVRRWHPDVAGASGAVRMPEINRAHDVLGDPLRRLAYDEQMGLNPSRWREPGGPTAREMPAFAESSRASTPTSFVGGRAGKKTFPWGSNAAFMSGALFAFSLAIGLVSALTFRAGAGLALVPLLGAAFVSILYILQKRPKWWSQILLGLSILAWPVAVVESLATPFQAAVAPASYFVFVSLLGFSGLILGAARRRALAASAD